MKENVFCRIIDGGYVLNNQFNAKSNENCYYLLVVEKGFVEILTETDLTRVDKSRVCLVPSLQIKSVNSAGAQFYYVAVELKIDGENIFEHPIVKSLAVTDGYALKLIKNAIEHTNTNQIFNTIKAVTAILELVSLCLDKKETISKSFDVAKAVTFIDYNYTEQFTLSHLAEKFGCSVNHFIIKFKQTTGYTPIKYILMKKIESAKELLKNKNLSINAVMERVGFLDASYFSKIFKKWVGCSPKDYKGSFN